MVAVTVAAGLLGVPMTPGLMTLHFHHELGVGFVFFPVNNSTAKKLLCFKIPNQTALFLVAFVFKFEFF
jgi:hypothetical protein